jgi:PASTA domain
VPHDVELPLNRTLLQAAKKGVRDEDLAESSPDHLGANLDVVEDTTSSAAPVEMAKNSGRGPVLKPAAEIAQFVPQASMPMPPGNFAPSAPSPERMSGKTVVLDPEQGGIVVPSFLGKPLRSAVESAQDSGIELDVVGDGIARDQQPPPGAHVTPGTHVVVRFER